MSNITVFGSGAWGTALAIRCYNAKHNVCLWCYEEEVAETILNKRENSLRLPGVKIPTNINITTDIKIATQSDIILIVVPAQNYRSFLMSLKPFLKNQYIIVCSKGIETDSGKLLTEVAEDILPKFQILVLSGPSFANEVGNNHFCEVNIAAKQLTSAQIIANTLTHPSLTLHPTTDIIGTQITGALKNVFAILFGMLAALKYGQNLKAALFTRAYQEIISLGLKMGAKKETFASFSGIGDLFLTCNSMESRNMTFGYNLINKRIQKFDSITEGVATTKAVYNLSKKFNISMPICEKIYMILYEKSQPKETIQKLFSNQNKDFLESVYG